MKQGETIRGSFDPDRVRFIQEAIPAKPRDTQKTMGYFIVPHGRRLVEYEQLTAYAQHGADWAGGGLETGDYMQKHAGGRGAFSNETTEMVTRDWYKFRDPNRAWFYPYAKEKSEDGRTATRFFQTASAEGRARDIDQAWLPFLEVDLGVVTFYEYGLFNAHSSAAKDALSDLTRNWLCFAAFHKDDSAQMPQYERVFLAKQIEGFSAEMDRPKSVWTKSAIYAPIREAVEQVWGDTYDWVEILWAAHGVIDPIFGQFLRREFWQAEAPLYGDSITPWIINQAIGYHEYAKAGVRDLFDRCLANDPEFGNHNRAVLSSWTAKWLPKTLAGLQGFLRIYEHLPNASARTQEAVERRVSRVIDDWVEDFSGIPGYSCSVEKAVQEVMKGLPGIYWKNL